MTRYQTDPRMRYESEEVWFAASLYVASWEEDFHQLMLDDHLRMVAYEQAIKSVVKPGMAVADLGTGTGILAQWALEAGARVVYGIDVNESIITRARERLERAGFAERFQIFNALSYDVTLPEPVDVLISEILGNLADNEGMTAILNDARRRFLGPGGTMLPRRASSFVVPVAAPRAHDQIRQGQCRGLSERYRLEDLLARLSVKDPFQIYYDVILPASGCLSRPARVVELAFTGADPEEYVRELSFPVEREGPLTGFKGYFQAELAPDVVLDISGDDIDGRATSDSWKHCYLPIARPIPARPGDVVELRFSRSRPARQGSPFQQRYTWAGSVRRGNGVVATFESRME